MDTNLKKSTILAMVAAAFLLLMGISGSRMTFATADPDSPAVTSNMSAPELANPAPQEKDKKDRDVLPPKLIRKVEPVYPDEARKAGIEGTVTLEGTTDNFGRVQVVKVVKSVPELDQAAADAVKQWVYEPMIIDGKPFGVTFTVTCRFSLKDKQAKSFEGGVTEEGEKPPFLAIGDIKPPKLIKKVEPVYPAEAKEAGIEGVVILEATTDIYGRVVKTKILRSIPVLDQAAIEAVEQWVYEPMLVNGEPRGIIFTVTCRFKLDDPVRTVRDTKAPKLIKKIEPVYPAEAKEAGIEGVVIVETTIDIQGRVVKTKILRSIPALDQAAIDAVKQWVYEPMIIDGEPKEMTITVTVVFKK